MNNSEVCHEFRFEPEVFDKPVRIGKPTTGEGTALSWMVMTCRLRLTGLGPEPGEGIVVLADVLGAAYCSTKDEYNHARALKLSAERAIAKLPRGARDAAWKEFFTATGLSPALLGGIRARLTRQFIPKRAPKPLVNVRRRIVSRMLRRVIA